MTRKKKPDHLKVLSGTDQPCRMNPDQPDARQGAGTAPDWLSERAAEIFDQLTAILHGMGIASPDDSAMLAMAASRLEEVEICTTAIEDGGRTYETISTSGGKMIRARPEVSQRSEAMRHAQTLLSEFGLSPASRAKVSAAKEPKDNPFAALDKATG